MMNLSKKLFLFTAMMIVSLAVVGCATVFNGSEQMIKVDSNIEGAEIYFGENLIGKTPFEGKIKRANNRSLTLKKEGYEDQRFLLPTRMNGLFWINVPLSCVGGSTGATTDVVSGSVWQYDPQKFFVTLKPMGSKTQIDWNKWQHENRFKMFQVINWDQLEKEKARHQTGVYSESLQWITSSRP